jgi:hypothetical protein
MAVGVVAGTILLVAVANYVSQRWLRGRLP